MKKLYIIGAGGHGRVVYDIAFSLGYTDVAFLDDHSTADAVEGKVADYEKFKETAVFFVAIGNNAIRKAISERLLQANATLVSLVHPSAVVGSNVSIGKGTVVMPNAVINNSAVISDGVIINTAATVDHDSLIGPYSHISVGSHLCGTVVIGEECFICAGATVINNIKVCGGCTVGAGAAVIQDITQQGVYVGVPAKRIK